MDIHVLHQQEHSIRSISRQLSIARTTVRCYLRNIARTPNYGPRSARPSKLDPLNLTFENELRLLSLIGSPLRFYYAKFRRWDTMAKKGS
ncbi:hypothetical protein PSECIP111951_04080 [Pseudoalteromonas holothuriae]|uniref:HTH IS21-type domain-containing protein n=1 Tax=Pseudoalteromonas holothuriae TaxID=2963714 RepID=A0ABM9GNI3_9GAMM|nr:hypothetical protein PSECIP111951_04080 [Pseudoalteromonas sp. CIP111951]